jgi:arylmalonate decarboxylase
VDAKPPFVDYMGVCKVPGFGIRVWNWERSMHISRRDVITLGTAAAAYAAFGGRAALAATEPALGLIFPPLNYPVPPDAKRLYPDGVQFLSGGVGLPGGMTLAGYDEAVPRILPAAEALARQGAKVISVFGSSLTFYKGAQFNADLVAKVTRATGLPATTQSNGLIDGLKTANAKRVAVATAYTATVTGRLKVFLEEHGFTVTSAKGLGYEQIPEGAATQEILFKLGIDAYAASGKADALVVSCGALRTLDLIVPLENQIKVPVVSSTPHGLMNGVRLLGVSPRVQGFGMVFAKA